MAQPRNRFRVILGQAIIIAVTLVFFIAAREPVTPKEQRAQIASRFTFEATALPHHAAVINETNYVDVNPHMKHIATWMSSVGAGATFFDFDGDGLANDLCVTDPRSRSIAIYPAPKTGERYPMLVLVDPKDYDSARAFPTGCRAGDFNEDGHPDLLAIFFGRSPRLYIQKAPVEGVALSRDSFTVQEMTPTVQDWYTATALVADVDGDGHSDIIIANYFRDNDGIYDKNSTAYPELHQSLSNAKNAGANHMYLWDGVKDGQVAWKEVFPFTEEQSHRWTLAVGSADLDKDGLAELYFANDFGPDTLFLNRSTPGNVKLTEVHGRKGFTIPKSKVLGHDSFKGMGIDFADINDDGYFDMFISNIAGEWQLEESHLVFVSTGKVEDFEKGIAPYVDRSEPLGMSRSSWGWDTKFGDFDNDGTVEALQATGFISGPINRWPEMHQWATGNDALISDPKVWPYMMDGDISGKAKNPFYVKGENGRYEELSEEVGMGSTAVTRGFGLSDVDGDGDLDLAVANQWADSIYYENKGRAAADNKFLGLHVLYPIAAEAGAATTVTDGHPSRALGRAAVNALITVHMPDGSKRVSQVDGGNGHSGARSPDVHVGLGKIAGDAPLKVDIVWRSPNGKMTEQVTVKPGWHTVVLGTNGSKG